MLVSRVACVLAASFSIAFAGPIDGARAQIAISDLKPSYCKGELLEVTIWNRGAQAISINVAIEALVDERWVEAWASLKTPPDQVRTQRAEPDLIKPRQSVAYAFDIFRFPIRADLTRAKWRLRVDTLVETQQKPFVSSEFALCSD